MTSPRTATPTATSPDALSPWLTAYPVPGYR